MASTTHEDKKDSTGRAARTKDAPGAKPVEKSHRSTAKDCTEHWEDEEHLAQNKKDFREFRAHHRKSSSPGSSASGGSALAGSNSGDHGEVPGGMKRGRGANQAGNRRKKTKSESGEGDAAKLARGDKTRVPAEGQHVQWKSGKGFAQGEVVEVLYAAKEIEGQKTEASQEDPRLVVKTDSSGRVAVHKPEDVYFD